MGRAKTKGSDLEEGEACYYNDDSSIDPDIALSYIDEKLHSVLGHLQKDFEGVVSAENLGAKFGIYGSFLPTYQRSPSVWTQPKTPQSVQNFSSPIPPNLLPKESALHTCTDPSDAAQSTRLGPISHNIQTLHTARALSGDVSAKKGLCLPYEESEQVSEKFPLKQEPVSNKPVNPSGQRTLKFRLKVGAENIKKKTAAIYSGLGLTSPSSSIGNSPEGSGGKSQCQETLDESVNSMLQLMTSFPVPDGSILSPLNESLLCLARKEKLSTDNKKPVPAIKSSQEHSATLADDTASLMGDRNVTKEKKTKMMEKNGNLAVLNREVGGDYDGTRTSFVKQEVAVNEINMKNETLGQKHFSSTDMELNNVSSSICKDVDSVKGTMTPGVPREDGRNITVKKRGFSRHGMEETLSIGLVKMESESISDQEGGKHGKEEPKNSLIEKICASKSINAHKDVLAGLREDRQRKSNNVSPSFKANSGVSNCHRDPHNGTGDQFGQKISQRVAYHEDDENKMPLDKRKTSFESQKKAKGSQSNDKMASKADERLMSGGYKVRKKNKKADKLHNSKSLEDIQKIRDDCKGVLPKSRIEHLNNQIDTFERPFGDSPKVSNLKVAEKEQSATLGKSKEMSACKKIDTQLTSKTLFKEAVNDSYPSVKGGVTSEMGVISQDPVVIEEDWVCCDRCQTWRLLPYGTKPEQLPEKWLCNMLNWLPGMNHCGISEEETTNALRTLYQLPPHESQNNLQNHVDQTAAGAVSTDAWHFEQNHVDLSSHDTPNPGKKQGSKGIPCAARNGDLFHGSGSTKNLRQEVVKSRSLDDANQFPLESNLTLNSNVQNLNNSQNFHVERNTHKHSANHIDSGDAKQKKLKSKREADGYLSVNGKKFKGDVAFGTDKNWTAGDCGNFDEIGHGSLRGFPATTVVKSIEKHADCHYYKDAKSAQKERVQIYAKKQGEHTSLSLHTGSLDMKAYGESEISLKKRKLKDWQESQCYVKTSQNNGNHLTRRKDFVKEEFSDSEFRKGKKSRVSRSEGKDPTTSKGDKRLNIKNKSSRVLLSGSRENVKEEDRSIEKDQQPRKHKTKAASKPPSDDIDSLKRDLGSEKFSRAATSSSSKVSDSRKSKAYFVEVKDSPVESVSSSPMRTSNLDNLSPTRRDISGQDAARNVDVLDFRDKNVSQKFGCKFKSGEKFSSDFRASHLANSDENNSERPCAGDLHASEHWHNENKMNKNSNHENLRKSGKGPSLLSNDKDRGLDNGFGRVKVQISDPPSETKAMDTKQSLRDEGRETGSHYFGSLQSSDLKIRIKSIKDGKSLGSKASGKRSSDSSIVNHLEFLGHDGSPVILDSLCLKVSRVKVTQQEKLIDDFGGAVAKRSDQIQVESREGNSKAFPCQVRKQDPLAHVPQSDPRSRKAGSLGVSPVDSSGNDDLSKVNQAKNAVTQLGYPVPNQHAIKDTRSPLRKDASINVVTNALKEAENLRNCADRLKESGFGFECNEAYFQAALKFLHGASLLDTCNGDGSKCGEISQMQIYDNTAKLCEICAIEYEKRQEMAFAALAYKCMEVAHMRMVYCKNSITTRDRHDLQATLKTVPQGESPSSSASDVDNVNNLALVDKGALSKGTGALAGNHIVAAHNSPNFVRLLDFTKDVNSAMEASRKAHNAFAAANLILEEAQNNEGIISMKRVIDFSFQDVEELIRLVRLAIEATSRQGLSGSKE